MKPASTTKYQSDEPLPKESLDALEEFGTVLKAIYLRLKKEGYRIIDGQLVNINQHENREAVITKCAQKD